MSRIVKGSLVVGALLILGASVVAGMRGAASPKTEQGRTLNIAAAADLKFALDELVKRFREQHPEANLQVTYGSSGNFFAQLAHGAPFDVYLSADVAYPRELAEQGLVHESGVFEYAVGRLVLWVPGGSELPVEELGMRALLEPSVKRIAIANPQHAPYGRAAEAAMKSLGVHEAVKDKLVLGENIAQTTQFVQSGSADVGLIALALALAPVMRGQGRYWEVPLEAYPRLEQGGAILKTTRNAELALRFRSFLLGQEGQAILKAHGFFPPRS
jgi:molybdate transport system substrate-binding protein